MRPGPLSRLMLLAVAATALAACSTSTQQATTPTLDGPPGQASGAPGTVVPVNNNDPLEPVNRGIFWFNEALDAVLIRPVAEIYRAVLPDPAQRGVRNVLQNLRSPLDLANQTLQGDWDGAGDVVKRFAINTTVGLGGLIDVAGKNGIPYEYESFDQTLAVWGVPEGPYLVLPVIGSSSLRDAVGFGAEFYADPVSNYASNNDADWFTYGRAGLTVADTRAGYIDVIDDLKRNSFDYYAAMRSLYRQRRDNWIRDGAADPSQLPDIPDYDDGDAAPPSPVRAGQGS
ncbi:VacJ family lipoprotein [Aerophototrophica crusticola]|uniref:VacJ family lipoprotein n=1 Tax=Aerophototrophica crusticola TaxID=1709002 RepID=A0A858R8X0_9PROT|nr:VacJ family lipoprotein [Rhodospirillaceae bacterium B3]